MTNDEILKIAHENHIGFLEENGRLVVCVVKETDIAHCAINFAKTIIEHDRQSSAEPVAWHIEVDNSMPSYFVKDINDATEDIAEFGAIFTPLYTRPQTAQIPEGWKLVPIEPTIEMSIAFAEEFYVRKRAIDDDNISDWYSAMLEAAPQPETKP